MTVFEFYFTINLNGGDKPSAPFIMLSLRLKSSKSKKSNSPQYFDSPEYKRDKDTTERPLISKVRVDGSLKKFDPEENDMTIPSIGIFNEDGAFLISRAGGGIVDKNVVFESYFTINLNFQQKAHNIPTAQNTSEIRIDAKDRSSRRSGLMVL